MRRPLSGLLLASTWLASTLLAPGVALADPPLPAPPVTATLPAAPTPPPAAAPYAAAAPYGYPAPGAPWAATLAPTERRSSGAMGIGIFLASVGAIGMGIGTAVYVNGAADCSPNEVSFGTPRGACQSSSDKRLGMTVLLASAGTAVLGTTLWIYGAEKVLKPDQRLAPVRSAAVIVGPAAAALRVTF